MTSCVTFKINARFSKQHNISACIIFKVIFILSDGCCRERKPSIYLCERYNNLLFAKKRWSQWKVNTKQASFQKWLFSHGCEFSAVHCMAIHWTMDKCWIINIPCIHLRCIIYWPSIWMTCVVHYTLRCIVRAAEELVSFFSQRGMERLLLLQIMSKSYDTWTNYPTDRQTDQTDVWLRYTRARDLDTRVRFLRAIILTFTQKHLADE